MLAGVTVASFFTALQTFVQQRNTDTLQEVNSGSSAALNTGWSDVWVLAPYGSSDRGDRVARRRLLDVLGLGDHEAGSLGVDVRRVRLSSWSPRPSRRRRPSRSRADRVRRDHRAHAIRLVTGTSYRGLLPLSFVVGAGFLILADLVARTVLSPAEFPIGVVTALCGAPFFALSCGPAADGHEAIGLEAVTVTLGGRPVVREVTATSRWGSGCALLGPNGAGKTSLLRAIAGLLPCHGVVSLNDVPAAALGRRAGGSSLSCRRSPRPRRG